MISKSMSVVLSSSLYPRVYPVHLMSVIQCQVSIDPQTKPTQFGCKYACRQLSSTFTITTTVVRPFSGTIRWADARRELLDFMVQGKINTGRHTQTIRLGATPSGLTSAHLHHPHIHHHHLLSLKQTMMLCVHWQYKKLKKWKQPSIILVLFLQRLQVGRSVSLCKQIEKLCALFLQFYVMSFPHCL